MSDIFLVSQGEYSDYHIVAVFDNQEKANELSALIEDADVETYPLNKEFTDPGLDFFWVTMGRDGDSECDSYSHRLACDGELREEYIRLKTSKEIGYVSWELTLGKHVKSKEHAVRLANEIRRQILAGQRPKGVDYGKSYRRSK